MNNPPNPATPEGQPIAKLRLLPDDLMERVQRAIDQQATGDWEVLRWIAINHLAGSVIGVRDGTDVEIRVSSFEAAICLNMELRPGEYVKWPEKETSNEEDGQ